ncbi:MAG TPA: DUF1003 domain-containing protein [Acidimicrobiales bacterium]|nr:DUF1003 domain-containing protein [Acidimicrobiales bacterium]
MRRRDDVFSPRGGIRFDIHYDPDAFGRFSEAIARLLGTARFLVIQTAIVTVWIAINIAAAGLRWDPYPFILLNLAFSTQAAYAAPLILLAQSRQAERDRIATERDREVAARSLADTEFLARELASIRIALADVVTTGDLDRRLERLEEAIGRAVDPGGAGGDANRPAPGTA